MAAYKDEQRGTWYVSFHYYDWTGKNCRKVKRGFKTKREALFAYLSENAAIRIKCIIQSCGTVL